jgi:phage shock protein PspC (stress-responsive transcriptional regulator)
MNKTIIININGIIFHIEEEAYEILQAYMVDVKKHFGHSIDSQEIVGDIENRIAEMFSERLNDQKAVILMEDVKEVCAQMGQVEDFEIGDETTDEFAQEPTYSYREERSLFRDPDDKILGGVCSGLGHYFGVESKWVRLIFLIIFFFGGTGLLIYIVLWIVLPKAKTRADKMKMRGEPANLENFKRSFQEEMGDVKRNFSEAGERARTSLNDSNSSLNSFINLIGKVIIVFIKIIGVLIIFCLSITLIGLIIALFLGSGFWDARILDNDFPLYAVSEQFRNALMIAVFFVMAIPLLLLILLAIRVLFNRKVMGRYFGFSLLIIWLVAIGFSISYITKTAIDFKEEATITQEINLFPQTIYRLNLRDNNTIIIKKEKEIDSLNGFKDVQKSLRYNERSFFNHNRRISLRIERIDANQTAMLMEEFSAKGRTFEIAADRAERITYSINQDGENLWFASNATLPKDELIRDQEVYVKLFLPVGTRLIIPKEFERKINIRGLSIWECENSYPNDEKPRETEWLMTETGLKCIAANSQLTNPNQMDSLSLDSSRTVIP